MRKDFFKVTLSEYISQRGTGQAIKRKDSIAYDYMPVILGDRFRTDEVLSAMSLRQTPADSLFWLMFQAYETLGEKYVSKGELIPALECYRIILDTKTAFARFAGGERGEALLNHEEIDWLKNPSNFESNLVEESLKLNGEYDQTAYADWVEGLRAVKKEWFRLNNVSHEKEEVRREYIESCLKLGKYSTAMCSAGMLNDESLVKKIERAESARPKEILDIEFLEKYFKDNYPEREDPHASFRSSGRWLERG